MFNNRSDKNELLDDLSLSNDDLRKNLNEMEILNRWFGSKKLLIKALNKIKNIYPDYFNKNKIVIADLGCGNGDLLRAIHQWTKYKNINTELIGIDANPFIVQYAKEKSQDYNIEYSKQDILSCEFAQHQFDIVCLNSICHHFSEKMLIQLFQKLVKQTGIAIIINDLQRHWLSYYTIKWLSKWLNLSYLAQNDAPLSVLRAFQKRDLFHLLNKANIKSYQLQWVWPFRWQLIIWCSDR